MGVNGTTKVNKTHPFPLDSTDTELFPTQKWPIEFIMHTQQIICFGKDKFITVIELERKDSHIHVHTVD